MDTCLDMYSVNWRMEWTIWKGLCCNIFYFYFLASVGDVARLYQPVSLVSVPASG